MLARMKKPRIEKKVKMHHGGKVYKFPIHIAKKYQVSKSVISSDEVFADIHKKYTKPGCLLQGLRYREGLTQVQLARKLYMTQSDVSQMENGTRRIGREVAKRIGELFHFNYRAFLE